VAKVFYLSIIAFVLIILIIPLNVKSAINDPTKPLITPVLKKTINKKALEKKTQPLSAIFIKQGESQAIINNRLYRVGDFFYGKKIIAIDPNSVLLKSDKILTKLTLIKSIKISN